MSATQIVFYILAAVTVLSALAVVFQRSPLYSALALVTTLVAMALLFVQLSAEFLAAIQVIVYAGATMVLFVFIIMLLNLGDAGGRELAGVPRKAVGVVLLGVIFAAIQAAIGVPTAAGPVASPEGFGGVERVGLSLFGDYVLPFELAGVLLLGAILGTIVLARRKP